MLCICTFNTLILSCKKYVDEGCSFVLGTLWSIWKTNICFFFASSTIFLTTGNICKAFVFIKQSWSSYIKKNRVLEALKQGLEQLTEEKSFTPPSSEIVTIRKNGGLKYVTNRQTNHTFPEEEPGQHALSFTF